MEGVIASVHKTRVILKLNMTFGWELVVLHATPSMFGIFSVCKLGGIGQVWTKNIIYNSLKVKLILACQGGAKMSPAPNEPKYALFIQIQKLPLSMHHKWKNVIDIVCKTTNGES